MDADLIDGDAGDDHGSSTCRDRARDREGPDHDRLLEVGRSSRPACSCVQGKAVVNSISLKEGEDDFLAKAATMPPLRRRGRRDVLRRAAVRPTRSSARSRSRSAPIRLLIDRAGFDAEDIIIDPNILAVATGIEEHNEFAKAFIEATREIKRRCPGAKVCGGVSNLSLLVPRERAGPPRDALGVPVPRDRGRARHGDRERGPARRLRGHPARTCSSTSRT